MFVCVFGVGPLFLANCSLCRLNSGSEEEEQQEEGENDDGGRGVGTRP